MSDRHILRDPKTGHLLKGTRALNPGGRPSTKANRAILERLIGKGGERAYEAVLDIAEGRTTIETLAREPRPHEDSVAAALIPVVKRAPSIRERLDAWTFLIEQLNGKSPSSLDVSVDGEVRHTSGPEYRALTDEDLSSLEKLLRRARYEAAEEEDGDLVP